MKGPQHSAHGAPQQQTQGKIQGRRSQEASHEVATEFGVVWDARTVMQETQQRHSTTAQQRNSARDTAEQKEQNAADRISH